MKLKTDGMTRGEFKAQMKQEMKERGAEGRAGFFFEAVQTLMTRTERAEGDDAAQV